MREEEILAGLAEALGAVAGVNATDVTPTARFADDLGIDSLTLVDLVVALEDRFGLVISDEEWGRFVTVGDAVAYLDRATLLPN